MTPDELKLCVAVGLVRELSPGRYELTHTGRKLLGEQPPKPQPESNAEWMARVGVQRGGA